MASLEEVDKADRGAGQAGVAHLDHLLCDIVRRADEHVIAGKRAGIDLAAACGIRAGIGVGPLRLGRVAPTVAIFCSTM